MKAYRRVWLITTLLALCFQTRAVLDEVISLGGGLDEPTMRLSHGDTSAIQVNEGGTLQSRCDIEEVEDMELYEFTWITRDSTGEEREIARGPGLYLTDVNADTFMNPIFCRAERTDDGEQFYKQMAVNFHGRTQPRTLEINPMPSEDMRIGRVVRRCELVPQPPSQEQWTYSWTDPSGRTISNSDILSIQVTGEQPSVTYTCHATNVRTNDRLEGMFTVHARTVPGTTTDTYNTQIEPISSSLEFGHSYEARCFVEPRPSSPVEYTWYFRDQIVSQRDRLLINSFNRISAGEYVCVPRIITGYADSDIRFANATLGLRLKPSTEDHTEMRPPPGSTLITNIGETRELHCEISPRDRGGVRWYLNGTEVTPRSTANSTGNLARVDYLRFSIMTINGVEEFHEGTWECRSDSEVKQVDVIVLSDYDVEVNPPHYLLDEGEDAEIHCSVQSGKKIPNTALEWFFRPVGSNSMRPVDFGPGGFVRTDDPRSPSTSVITKFNVRLFDEGEYICREPRGQTGISTLQIRKVERHTLHMTPGVVKIRPGQTVDVMCYSMQMDRRTHGPRPNLRAYDNRLNLQINHAADNSVKGTIYQVDASMNGTTIECYSDTPGVEPVKTVIYVEDICPPGYRRCRNGECLEAGRFCDGNRDCRDGSDEDPTLCSLCDPIVRTCESYRGLRPEKQTYMVHWQCDGEDDCGNGFDEANCNDPSISFCANPNYQCPRSGLQIPRAYMCDSVPECDGGSDEESCREPQIIDSPRGEYNHRRGETVTLTCEVAGHPNPRVIWRFNWGCLPAEGSRMTVVNRVENCNTPSEKTVSTLTIRNFMPGDDGIYNCEGLNLMKRAMSRDYVVMISG